MMTATADCWRCSSFRLTAIPEGRSLLHCDSNSIRVEPKAGEGCPEFEREPGSDDRDPRNDPRW